MKFLILFIIPIQIFAQNVQVSNGNAFNGEPYLVISPQNPNHLTAAWMGFELGQGVVIKTSISSNGGATWSTPFWFNHQVAGYGSADVSMGYDNSGNLYIAYIDFDNNNYTGGYIMVAKSSDEGATWSSPVIAMTIADCPNKLCIDRPWIAVDNSSGANSGTIYVTTTNANQPSVTSPYHPYIVYSTDQGQTFSALAELDGVNYLAGSAISQPMASPVVKSDGTFCAVYPSYVPSQSLFAELYLAKSSTPGTYTYNSIASSSSGGTTDPLAKKGPLLISNPNNTDQLAYFFIRDEFGDLDVFFIETMDGTTWTSPTRVNQDPTGNGKMQDLVWAAYNENGDLAVSWRDRRNGSSGYQTSTEIYGTVRFAGNPSFEPDFAHSSQMVSHQAVLEGSGNDFMSVKFSSDTIYTLWGDVRSGILEIYLNKYDVTNGTSSITEITSEFNQALVYPNPATSEIQLFNVGTHQLTIYNSDGKEYLRHEESVPLKSVNVEAWPNGTYFIQKEVDNKAIIQQFTISH